MYLRVFQLLDQSDNKNIKTKFLVVSSILPVESSGGQVVLYRHLSRLKAHCPNICVVVFEGQQAKLEFDHVNVPIRKFIYKLRNLFSRKFSESVIHLGLGVRFRKLLATVDEQNPDVIITVAHGELYYAAMKISKSLDIPLISIYHDWWPEMPTVYPVVRKILQNRFHQLAESSGVNLCVSDGMIEKLNAPNSILLYPIPSEGIINIAKNDVDNASSPHITYAGTLFGEYGTLLRELVEANDKRSDPLYIEITGPSANWIDKISSNKATYKGMLDKESLHYLLQSSEVLLVIMSFRIEDKNRMETSFPSKLIEYLKFGRPIVIWGPPYCSASTWAKANNAALVVDVEQAEVLLSKVTDLMRDSEEMKRLSSVARSISNSFFRPEEIQSVFENQLAKAATRV